MRGRLYHRNRERLTLRRLGLAAPLIGCALTACAQSDFDPSDFASTLPGATAPATGPDTWSGQSGASGHPAMSADAIRSAAAKFPQCVASLWPRAAKRGVSRRAFDALTAGLTPDLQIMDRVDAQPEFTKPFWDYLDILVTDERIAQGRAMLTQYRPVFDAVERTYGVDRYILTAIWGIESKFGTAAGERSVLRSTATLACIGRRQNYFRDEFIAALQIAARGDVAADDLKGSWAGAFGGTQFMPTAFRRAAVDFDRDGRRDLVNSVPDILASTANKLKQSGWRPGQTWGYEVAMPPGFNYALADGAHTKRLRDWGHLGLQRVGGQAFPRPADRATLLVPAGAQGPAFFMLANFRAIMKYNPSEAYALAIGHLADRIRGGGPLVQPWPRHQRPLSREERYELQQLLARHGYDVGEPDGHFGPKTRNALRRYQTANGWVADGFATGEILDSLRRR